MASLCSSAYALRSRGLIFPPSASPNASSPSPPLRMLHFPHTPSSDFPLVSRALKTSNETNDVALLRKPSIDSVDAEIIVKKGRFPELVDLDTGEDEEAEGSDQRRGGGPNLLDWEDRLLEDTVPIVGFVRSIIHSGKLAITDFEKSRCLSIVRKDGVLVDFSFWKCIKGFIRKEYPLFADSFIVRHLHQRKRIGQAPM